MSNTTVVVLPAPGAHPVVRFNQLVDADLELNAAELKARRIEQAFPPTSTPRRYIPRRSRKSAWVPSEY